MLLKRLDVALTGNRQPATGKKKYRKLLPTATVIGTTEQEWDLPKKSLCSQESAVANMITDLIRKQFTMDFVNMARLSVTPILPRPP